MRKSSQKIAVLAQARIIALIFCTIQQLCLASVTPPAPVYCEVLAPAAAQSFDNSGQAHNGGTAKDDYIIFRMGSDNTYTLSSPFRPQDSSCWVEYKLVMKGTDTLVKDAGWDANRVYIKDGKSNG